MSERCQNPLGELGIHTDWCIIASVHLDYMYTYM